MAELRDETRKGAGEMTGMSKAVQVDLGLNQIMAEGVGFDLLTMGHPEGPGCYCYVNALLKDWIKKTSRNYAACVIDNQAGMEHLSRLVTAAIDTLVMVSEPSIPSARAVSKIMELSKSLPMSVGRRVVVWNRVRDDGVPGSVRKAADEESADAVFELRWSDRLAAAYTDGAKLTLEGLSMPALDELADLCRSPASHTAPI